ncbi:MAG: quinoprotein dehydrogenase-associated SoxYZ-like carrier [Legionellales bacterium]|nr:quinoprotein dehydrogenase-associated SoxYZ-like carrier [Legionellales bacterium]
MHEQYKFMMIFKIKHSKKCLFNSFIFISLLQFSFPALAVQTPQDLSDQAWEKNLRKQNFQERKIIEGADQEILEVKAPIMAEDASIVPLSIHTKIVQTKERYIKKMHIFVDKNPMPLVGIFEFTPDSGKADLAMRIRINEYSYIRSVAELNTGELYMSKSFVKAKGACSAPPPASMGDSIKLLGKMKMKVVGLVKLGRPNLMQIRVRHPNITGLAPERPGSSVIPPAFFVDTLEVEYNNKPIVKALLTFSISMDPTLRFYFFPENEGILTVTGTDTKSDKFSSTHAINVWKPKNS